MRVSAAAGELMDNIGGYVNPLRLLQRIPDGMCVEGLRDRLVHIIADFRTQTSLREGCNSILHTDCLLLAQVLPSSPSLSSAACAPKCLPRSVCAAALAHGALDCTICTHELFVLLSAAEGVSSLLLICKFQRYDS